MTDQPEDPIAEIIDAYFGDARGPDFDAAIDELVAAGMPRAVAERALNRRHRLTRDDNAGEQVNTRPLTILSDDGRRKAIVTATADGARVAQRPGDKIVTRPYNETEAAALFEGIDRDSLPELESLPSERAEDPPELDEIEADARAPRYLPGTKFVNVYLTDRAYGGPEEGGWWYDTAEAVRSTQALVGGDAARLLQTERAWCSVENSQRRSDTGSVLSQGRYEVEIDDVPAADRPTERPHYE